MMKIRKVLLTMAAVLTLAIVGCTEHIDESSRYVFRESTILDYLQKHSDVYGQYLNVLQQTPIGVISNTRVAQLLSARGRYTVFAPTDQAIDAYLRELVEVGLIAEPRWEAFRDSALLDSIRKVIVYNSIINGGDDGYTYETSDFPLETGGDIATATLNDHKLNVRYVDDPDSIYVNNDCPVSIQYRDIHATNGIVHQMGKVIAPQDLTAQRYFQTILDGQKEGFLVLARTLQACGLFDTLQAIRDDYYEYLYQTGQIHDSYNLSGEGLDFSSSWTPSHRKYGFTIFAETDEFWKSQGIDPRDPDLHQNLIRWILDNHQYAQEDQFTTDSRYDRPDNLLYQWITYHILPMRLSQDRLVIHYNEVGYNLSNPGELSVPVYEIYTTFGKPRILKVYQSRESEHIYLNRFPLLDNGRKGTNHEISCDADKTGSRVFSVDEGAVLSDMINCNLYPIDKPLSYNDEVRENLMKQRLRFEIHSMIPDLMTNDIRQNMSGGDRNCYVYLPTDAEYRYCSNVWIGPDSRLIQCNYLGGNPSMNADEIKCGGKYDVTFTLPPVPKRGTYELRYAILNRDYRGVCQIYLSDNREERRVTGIPVDMTKELWSHDTGWEADTEDQEYNAEIDKKMRSLGYMKGCHNYGQNGDINQSMRLTSSYSCMRQIVIRDTFEPDRPYYITFKNVMDRHKELYTDYFEWCAKEIYDNPAVPEDIW